MKFHNTEVWGLKNAIRAMHNLLQYTNNDFVSDSGFCKGGLNSIGCENCSQNNKCKHDFDNSFQIGHSDLKFLKTNLEHLNKIHVVCDVSSSDSNNRLTYDTTYAKLRKQVGESSSNDLQKWVRTLPYADELILK